MGWSQDTWAPTHAPPGSLLASWGHLCEMTTQIHLALKGPRQCPAVCREETGVPVLEASLSQKHMSSLISLGLSDFPHLYHKEGY